MIRLLDLARLVRLPNVFTAMADICLGALVTGALPDHWLRFILLLLASTSLYMAGMVWNDYFDLAQDKKERPFRPLASGRIPLTTAFRLGTDLLVAGWFLAALADGNGGTYHWLSTVLTALLVVAILLYDGWLKRTWAGPIAMGTCRFLNVLLGLSVVPGPLPAWGWLLALVVGVYIAGVTWFARTEAVESNKTALKGAAAVMLAGLILGLAVPPLARESNPTLEISPLFPYLLVAFAFAIGRPISRALARPLPERVQPAIKRAVLGLVFLDAILAAGLIGWTGLGIALLWVPAAFLGRWVYST